jgi:hypothetical protein
MEYRDITTRHGFLAALHHIFKPRVYLEVGVQYGTSLNLAHAAQTAIGIDPHPLVAPRGNQVLMAMTSDEFFAPDCHARPPLHLDLTFIDGMHLAEYAMRDFANVEQYCHPRSIVVFDDVLPRNLFEARRIEPGQPVIGDWTGDIWLVHQTLRRLRPDLALRLVDVQPTGLLVVTGFNDRRMPAETEWALDQTVGFSPPESVYGRNEAIAPLAALQQLRTELEHVTPPQE